MTYDSSKRYEFVTRQIVYHNDKMIEAFTLYVKLLSAVIGGAVWLAMQSKSQDIGTVIGLLVSWLICGIALACILLILTNLSAWWGFRKTESEIVGAKTLSPPSFPRSCLTEIVMIVAILASVIAGFTLIPSLIAELSSAEAISEKAFTR